jgi:hypothetical protein
VLSIRVAGSPHEIGEKIGRAYPLAVYRVAAEALRRHHTARYDVAALRRELDRRAEVLRQVCPDGFGYLDGLAEGSTIPLWKLILVHPGLTAEAWGRVGVAAPVSAEGAPGGQCTIAGFQNAAEGPLVGGNLDDPAWHFLSFETPRDGYRCLQVRLPGYWLTWGGMNEHGLCVTGASGGPALPGTPDAQTAPTVPALTWGPVQDILYHCRTVAEAIDLVGQPQYSGNNYLAGDPQEVVQIEKRYDGVTVRVFREPEDAPLCAGNLRRSDFGQSWYDQHLPSLLPSHLARHRLVLRLMAAYRGSPGVEALKAVLNHHGDGPAAVDECRSLCHVGSALTLIGIPRQRRVLVGEAPVCINGYQEHDLAEACAAW